jgi:hypothetical protein
LSIKQDLQTRSSYDAVLAKLLKRAGDQSQWRPQFMTNIGEKATFGFIELVKLEVGRFELSPAFGRLMAK